MQWTTRQTETEVFKDTVKYNLKRCGISLDSWESTTQARETWRRTCKEGIDVFENVPVSSLRNMPRGKPTVAIRTHFINAISAIGLSALEVDSTLTKELIGNVSIEYS